MSSFTLDQQPAPNGQHIACMTVHAERFDTATFEDLRKAALTLSDQPPAAVVIQSAGSDFSRGLNLDQGSTLHEKLSLLAKKKDTYRSVEIVEHLHRCVQAINQVPCPILVAAEGRCDGPGAALALGADVLVVADNTTIGFPAIQMGLMDGLGGLSRILAQTGASLGIEVALAGRRLAALDLMELGYASHCVSPGTAQDKARQIAHQMVAETGANTRREILMGIRNVRRQQSKPYEEKMIQTAARTIVTDDLLQRLSEA